MQIMNLFVARLCGFCFNSSCEKIWKRLHELRYLEKILIHVVGIKLRNKICFQEDHSRMFVKLHNKMLNASVEQHVKCTNSLEDPA